MFTTTVTFGWKACIVQSQVVSLVLRDMVGQPISIEAMRHEIEGQVESLREYSHYLATIDNFSNRPAEDLVFAGSGDSYSVALWAHELSNGRANGYDPFELGLKPSWAQHKHVFILSVSGKTRANLFLARRLKGVAAKRVAITGSPTSELASECDETIPLRYRHEDTLTPGTASYTASLLACSHVLNQMPNDVRFEHNLNAWRFTERDETRESDSLKAQRREQKLQERKLVSRDGIILFIGSGIDYPLAQYGALKFSEVLGLKSFPSYPEQLGHALLFSLNTEKDRIVILDPTSNRRLREINQVLSNAGFSVYPINVPPQNPLSRTMELAFDLQILTYNLARDQGMDQSAFLSDKTKLEISNRLIY